MSVRPLDPQAFAQNEVVEVGSRDSLGECAERGDVVHDYPGTSLPFTPVQQHRREGRLKVLSKRWLIREL